MLFLLSPAKSLDYETPSPASGPAAAPTLPQFAARSAELIDILKTLSAGDVARLMDISAPLAELNVARYAAWRKRFTPRNSKPAVLAFAGDVYGGLDAATLVDDDLDWAQRHLLILSGLYGALRPLDRLQPYRLEMGTRLATVRGSDLYQFWGDTISRHIDRVLARDVSPVVVNLASQEYFRAVDRRALRARVIDCVFEDADAEGRFRVVSFFAKRARGLMARYAVRRRLVAPDDLRGFDLEGYAFDEPVSTPGRLVFRRAKSAG